MTENPLKSHSYRLKSYESDHTKLRVHGKTVLDPGKSAPISKQLISTLGNYNENTVVKRIWTRFGCEFRSESVTYEPSNYSDWLQNFFGIPQRQVL